MILRQIKKAARLGSLCNNCILNYSLTNFELLVIVPSFALTIYTPAGSFEIFSCVFVLLVI